jgi:hypothetical protein
MSAQEEENDLLLRAAADVGLLQLRRGSFLPFAAVLGAKRNAQTIFTDELEPDAGKEEIEQYWAGELSTHIVPGETRAVCYCIHLHVRVAEGGTLPCILIHLEHVQGGAENCAFPVRKDENLKFVLGQPMSQPAERVLFGQIKR